MLINSQSKIDRRLRHFENQEVASLMRAWKNKGSHKGDYLFLKIQELTGQGDFLETDWGNEKD